MSQFQHYYSKLTLRFQKWSYTKPPLIFQFSSEEDVFVANPQLERHVIVLVVMEFNKLQCIIYDLGNMLC